MNDKLNIPHCIKNYGKDSYPTEQGFVPEDVFLERLHDIAVMPSPMPAPDPTRDSHLLKRWKNC